MKFICLYNQPVIEYDKTAQFYEFEVLSELQQTSRALLRCILLLFLQTLKNALSPYKLGGAGGGSDFDPKGKSDNEVFVYVVLSSCYDGCYI